MSPVMRGFSPPPTDAHIAGQVDGIFAGAHGVDSGDYAILRILPTFFDANHGKLVTLGLFLGTACGRRQGLGNGGKSIGHGVPPVGLNRSAKEARQESPWL
jgi:hypothetical protein